MKSFKNIIHGGGIAVLRTDTLYGLVCDAYNQSAVDRIYDIKKRDRTKACIVLVDNYDQIRSFGVTIDDNLLAVLESYWPGKVSIILPANDTSIDTHYIHRGTGGIAFRIPKNPELRKLLKDVGPLVAPSANPEGKKPAENIDQAQDYFGDQVDYYIDGGDVIDQSPSQIIKISHTIEVQIIRN